MHCEGRCHLSAPLYMYKLLLSSLNACKETDCCCYSRCSKDIPAPCADPSKRPAQHTDLPIAVAAAAWWLNTRRLRVCLFLPGMLPIHSVDQLTRVIYVLVVRITTLLCSLHWQPQHDYPSHPPVLNLGVL
jgi:hypothetical protein